jgi:hypothetical protein
VSAKKVCGAKKRGSAGTCRLPAGHGTDHPGFGACSRHAGSTTNGKKAAARMMAEELGAAAQIDPHVALERAVAKANALLTIFEGRVAELDDDQLVSGETLHVWLRAVRDQPYELARIAKYAVEAGVAERHVRAIEQWSGPLALVLEAILRDRELALTPEQLGRAPSVVGRHLRALEAPGEPAEAAA